MAWPQCNTDIFNKQISLNTFYVLGAGDMEINLMVLDPAIMELSAPEERRPCLSSVSLHTMAELEDLHNICLQD